MRPDGERYPARGVASDECGRGTMDRRGGLRGWRLVAAIGAVLAVALVFGGTAAWARGARGEREGGGDAANQARLAREATITPDGARAAAVAAVPGTVQAVHLERDEGPLVYAVVVQPHGGDTTTEVVVDAKTGNVVRTLPADQQDDDDGD